MLLMLLATEEVLGSVTSTRRDRTGSIESPIVRLYAGMSCEGASTIAVYHYPVMRE
jgi:hypothetical protein